MLCDSSILTYWLSIRCLSLIIGAACSTQGCAILGIWVDLSGMVCECRVGINVRVVR